MTGAAHMLMLATPVLPAIHQQHLSAFSRGKSSINDYKWAILPG
jgi:hypothetical protein